MTVVDVYDALISRRIYKEACRTRRRCRSWLKVGAVALIWFFYAFLELQDEFRAIAARFVDNGDDMAKKAAMLKTMDR